MNIENTFSDINIGNTPGPDRAEQYPFLRQFAVEQGISEANLVAVFEIERVFHYEILATSDPAARRQLYADVYARVHPLLKVEDPAERPGEYEGLVRLFSRELSGCAILDVGCGTGDLLRWVHELLPHQELYGMDTSAVRLPRDGPIRFVQRDVTDFRLSREFDVVISTQVLEHIAPQDLPTHMESLRLALRLDGTLILCLPNRYWGPADVTRIVDNRRCGLTEAQGTHLNESSYSELVHVLHAHGFGRIRTILPGADHFKPLRSIRVPPVFNIFLERSARARTLLNRIKKNGKPVFTNPIDLIATRMR
jgi:2-polyprenyl-3-methyl-5-hydroxy-6-metoxy-1,4-benzoquinol methylase